MLPVASLPANRMLWLGMAAFVFALTAWRFRLEVRSGSSTGFKLRRAAPEPVPAAAERGWHTSFGTRDTLAQLVSQLGMDLRAVLLSPLFWLVVLLTIMSTVSEVRATVDPIPSKLPLHPVTSHLLSIFRVALFQFALIAIVFYSATLMHREREHRMHEILGASPYPDWVMLVSKVLALCSVLLLLLLVSMLVCIGMQAMAGYYDFELGVYLQGLFVNTGFYFCMFAVLACVLQTLVPGKWSGMLVVFAVLVFVIVLPVMGWQHVLYGFRIPNVVYTDMNGFGHFLLPTYSLIVYWGAFCVLLVVAGHLLLPRGADASVWARLRDAGTRLTRATKVRLGSGGRSASGRPISSTCVLGGNPDASPSAPVHQRPPGACRPPHRWASPPTGQRRLRYRPSPADVDRDDRGSWPRLLSGNAWLGTVWRRWRPLP